MALVITGITGHIGVNLLNEIRAHTNEKIKCLILPNDKCVGIKDENIKYFVGSILDYKILDQLIEKDDKVIHLAGLIDITKKNKDKVMSINYKGTQIISDTCLNKGASLTYISSVHVLNALKSGKIDENSSLNVNAKRGVYEESKSLATKYVLDSIAKGLDAKIVFPSAVIGPYDYKIGEITQALVMLYKGQIPFYIKGGYSFVDVRDVVKVIYKITMEGSSGDKCIASARYISIKDLMELADKTHGKKRFRIYVPTPLIYLGIPILSLISKITKTKPIFTKTMLDTVLSNGDFSNELMINKYHVKPRELKISINDTIDFVNKINNSK